jgi:O-antigen ligase
MAQPWRPLSLTPDLTLNSLIACIVPLAGLIGFAALRDEQRALLVPVLIGVAVLCSLLGAAQLAGGPHSAAYLYTITHTGVAVGFFANRNHEAALLAATYPALRVWTMLPARSPEYRRARAFAAFGLGLFLIPMILITGSRAGMGLALVGIAAAYFIAPWSRLGEFWRSTRGRLAWAALWLLPFVMAGLVTILGRAWAFQRVGTLIEDNEAELRIRNLPLMLDIARDHLPFGTGFGSFDPVFRIYEPDPWLSTEYFNHAHNELVEMALTGGIPALLLVAAFLIWFARAGTRVFRPYRHPSEKVLLGRLGAVMILQFLLASIVDYPLRTPLIGVIFIFAAGWLAAGAAHRREAGISRQAGGGTLP